MDELTIAAKSFNLAEDKDIISFSKIAKA